MGASKRDHDAALARQDRIREAGEDLFRYLKQAVAYVDADLAVLVDGGSPFSAAIVNAPDGTGRIQFDLGAARALIARLDREERP